MGRPKLSEVNLAGFKSIGPSGQTIKLGDITILLGANGAGKSNLVSFFYLINFITNKALQKFIGQQGGADSILYYGAKVTEKIDFTLSFDQKEGGEHQSFRYQVALGHSLPDRLFLADERVIYPSSESVEEYSIGSGSQESGLADHEEPAVRYVHTILSQMRTYQFHDTSDTAKIKASGYLGDCRYLRSNAGNLAAFLRMMKCSEKYKIYYDRIMRHIQKIMPQFGGFELAECSKEEDAGYGMLNWHEINRASEALFGPHQISDGSLRFMALATLLLQPPQLIPKVIVLDEPELGLHPAALRELAAMIRMAAAHCQVIVATQSTRLVDEFQAEEIVVVERDLSNRCSVFKRLNTAALSDWLARYSLSELWEKNVLGGLP
ncbi:MAG: AAA family ATPase [Magnetococcales bacterium]|nr:AAA family ATPase [Magnetococcales bacterium]